MYDGNISFLGNMFTIGAFGVIFDDKGSVLLCHRRDMDL